MRNLWCGHQTISAATDLPPQECRNCFFDEAYMGSNCWQLQEDGRSRKRSSVCGGRRLGMVLQWLWVAHCHEQQPMPILPLWQLLWGGEERAAIYRFQERCNLEIYFEECVSTTTSITSLIWSARNFLLEHEIGSLAPCRPWSGIPHLWEPLGNHRQEPSYGKEKGFGGSQQDGGHEIWGTWNPSRGKEYPDSMCQTSLVMSSLAWNMWKGGESGNLPLWRHCWLEPWLQTQKENTWKLCARPWRKPMTFVTWRSMFGTRRWDSSFKRRLRQS